MSRTIHVFKNKMTHYSLKFENFKRGTVAFTLLVTGFLSATGALLPKASHAIVVGVATGGPAAPILGAMGLITFFGGYTAAPKSVRPGEPDAAADRRWALFVASSSALGMILGGPSDPFLQFAPISQKQARLTGLSPASAALFNENLEEINALAETVSMELAKMSQPTIEDARAEWERNIKQLDEPLRDALQEWVTKALARRKK